MLLIHGHL
jgi:hypothetical protein